MSMASFALSSWITIRDPDGRDVHHGEHKAILTLVINSVWIFRESISLGLFLGSMTELFGILGELWVKYYGNGYQCCRRFSMGERIALWNKLYIIPYVSIISPLFSKNVTNTLVKAPMLVHPSILSNVPSTMAAGGLKCFRFLRLSQNVTGKLDRYD